MSCIFTLRLFGDGLFYMGRRIKKCRLMADLLTMDFQGFAAVVLNQLQGVAVGQLGLGEGDAGFHKIELRPTP